MKEAEDQNAQHGIFLDANGFVSGGANLDLLLYTGDKRLIVPAFDNCARDCIVYRILEIVNHFLANDNPQNRKNYEWIFNNIKSAEFVSPMRPLEIIGVAKELFLVGQGTIIIPIFQWDQDWIGDRFIQTNYELFQVIHGLIKLDMIHTKYDTKLSTPITNFYKSTE